MRCTCDYALDMSKMIQIRNVPDALHRKLKARAAIEGVSLSDLLLAEVRRLAERPSMEEIRQRIAQRSPVRLSLSAAEAVRQERDSR
jgi:antitoxin FitA